MTHVLGKRNWKSPDALLALREYGFSPDSQRALRSSISKLTCQRAAASRMHGIGRLWAHPFACRARRALRSNCRRARIFTRAFTDLAQTSMRWMRARALLEMWARR